MKVKDLIQALLECDPEKTVFIWQPHDIQGISLVDEMSDRVDINPSMSKRDRQFKALIMENAQ